MLLWRDLLRCLALLAGFGTVVSPAGALTPKSPEVQKSVRRAVDYLAAKANDPRVGAKALVGRVLVMHQQSDHPKVVEAVAALRQSLNNLPQTLDIYTLGISLTFLIELDPEKYRADIDRLLAELVRRQMPHGGWGYPGRATGDTSMTQNALLGAWVAQQYGRDLPLDAWVRATQWLLRTQDPNGAFGYQGVLAEPGKRLPQNEITVTMTAAGWGSLYLAGDRLGLIALSSVESTKLPEEFQAVKSAASRTIVPLTESIDRKEFQQALQMADGWYKTREKTLPTQFLNYFFYTYERLQTLRDIAAQRSSAEPDWYTDAAQYVIKAQRDDGAWNGNEDLVASTCFAVLFLTRSTHETIERARSYGSGILMGGRGVPSGQGDIELRLGKVVAKPLQGPAEELVAKLENPNHPDFDRALEGLDQLVERADVAVLGKLKRQLRALAADGSSEAKVAAITALGRSRDFEQAPLLITALTDPDARVARAAHDALRHMSRRFSVARLVNEPDEAAKRLEAEKWKAWYRTLKPDAQFN